MSDPIRNAQGERLDHARHAGGGPALVVIGHGVTANKDRAFLVALAEGLAAAGIDAVRVSFSGNGASEGRFVDSTVSKEVADLRSVLDWVGDRPVGYVGHSMGGAVGVLAAAADPRIRFLVSLAGMVETAEFARRKFGELRPGDLMWDKPECPLSQAFLDDMNGIGSVIDQAAGLRQPWLLVHGDADTVVPLSDSEQVTARVDQAELVRLAGAGHLFEGPATEQLVAAAVPWIAAAIEETA